MPDEEGVVALPEGFLTPRRVEVPLFEIHSNPQISVEEIRTRRFNLIERTAVPFISATLTIVPKHKSAWERILEDLF